MKMVNMIPEKTSLRHRRLCNSNLVHFVVLICSVFIPVIEVSAQDHQKKFQQAHSDFFRLLQADRSDMRFSYFNVPEQDEDGGAGEFSRQDFALDGELPLALNQDLFLRLGWETAVRRYDFSRVVSSATALDDSDIYTVVLRSGAGMFLTNDLLLTGVARFGAFSDFSDGLDSDDFELYGQGLVVYRINAGTQLVGGVAYSEDVDSQPLLPLIGIRILSDGGRIHLTITAPLEARIGYNILPHVQLYGLGSLHGEEFEIDAGPNSFKVRSEDRKAGAGVEYWFGETFSLRGEAGVLWGSELEFKTKDAGQFGGDLDPAGYFTLGLGFAL